MALPEAVKNRVDALAVVALAASSLFVAAGSYVINQHSERLDRKDIRITALEISRAADHEHVVQHESTANRWKQRIVDIEKNLHSVERRVDRIETKPQARPDPFTGNDGDRLEAMIKELQRKVTQPHSGSM